MLRVWQPGAGTAMRSGPGRVKTPQLRLFPAPRKARLNAASARVAALRSAQAALPINRADRWARVYWRPPPARQ